MIVFIFCSIFAFQVFLQVMCFSPVTAPLVSLSPTFLFYTVQSTFFSQHIHKHSYQPAHTSLPTNALGPSLSPTLAAGPPRTTHPAPPCPLPHPHPAPPGQPTPPQLGPTWPATPSPPGPPGRQLCPARHQKTAGPGGPGPPPPKIGGNDHWQRSALVLTRGAAEPNGFCRTGLLVCGAGAA